ncbi:MAG: hypothetical protein AB7N76_16050 [Planctomycetota bacterium]
MQDRLERLERQNRLLGLGIVALIGLQVGQLLAPRAPGAPSLPPVLPEARAGTIEAFKKEDPRPARMFTTGQSGSAIYEFVLTPEGKYEKVLWN